MTLLYLKSAHSKVSNCKISLKNENVSIWDQECLLWVVLGNNFKKLLSYLKSAPSSLSYSKIFQKQKKL